ncbi:MAG: hypothetical protein JNM09_27705 [Blastocatellia bacterium]|nr:hypothetical protein [Blastocatellia bacterium]
MKRTVHLKVFSTLISGGLICLIVLLVQAQKKPTPTPTPEKKVRVEDAIERRVSENKVIFKSGFDLTQTSVNRGEISQKMTTAQNQARRVIVGEIDCQCKLKPGTNSGNCRYSIENTTVTCTEHGGCTCKLVLTTKSTQ